ncbi:MAG: histidine kinase [Crocinitomicaceae bacterium]|nr:histidine kinase [Crocinitomicaceae bacterium]
MIFRIAIAYLFFLSISTGWSQDPSYQKLGEDELSGVDIYSICQDWEMNIWMTSNKGIIRYDGYEYKFLNTAHLKAMSAFGIRENGNGELYCFNLFGQVLKIKDDSVQVFVQLPDSLIFNRYEMEIQSDQSLYLRSDLDIHISKKGEVQVIHDNYPKLAFDSELEKLTPISTVNEKENSNTFFSPNHFVLYRWNGKKLNEFRMNRHHVPKRIVSHMVYRTQENNYIFTLRKGGVYIFGPNGEPLYDGHHLFADYQIGGFLEDYEGNLWLPTLGKGILFIKNQKILTFKDDPLLRTKNIIVSKFRSNGDLFLGSESGDIFLVTKNHEVSEVFSNGSVNIHFIEFYKNFLLSNGGVTIERIDIEEGISTEIESIAAVKESRKVGEKEFLFATSKFAYHVEMNAEDRFDIKNIYKLGRCNAILPLENVNDLLISSVTGMFHVKNNVSTEIQFEGNKITSSGLEKRNGVAYIGTTTKGIHLYENGRISKTMTTKDGLISDRIQAIKSYKNLLFISTSEGMQIYDMDKKEFILPFLNNVINGSRILDFSIHKNKLFVVTNKDLQLIDILQLRLNDTPPFVQITKFLVNDLPNQLLEQSNLSYDQNKIEFHFNAKSYGHKGKLKYQYRLLPVETEWETSDFLANKVKYPSLSPGAYTFEIKAINDYGVESEVISYHFKIEEPFWESWWFYLIVGSAVILLIVIVWRDQLRRIRIKNEKEKELIGSKLTALKLQMNPHFIFNALNSIQDLILKEDTENSYDYIVKFSNLVRRILNYSDQEFIEIEEEIEILQLYLELEDLRFKKDFEFKIINHIEEDIRIPSMLIQPFVENSVKHGLLHKEGFKSIEISFELKDVVVCTITDNGIGRSRSMEINSRKAHKPKSISIKSIENRMEILKSYYKSELGIKFVDLTDEMGQAIGTKVELRLPFENN